MKTSPLLEVKALTVKRGRNSLGPLSLTLSEGCGLTLVGSNGSGKSSFMLAIAGLLEATGGDVLLKLPRSDGKHDRRSHTEGWKRGLGWQGQQSGLWPHLSIRQQCYLLQDERNQSSLESFAEALSMVPLLDRMPHQLSGGESQRAEFMRALCSPGKLLLLDEPFSSQNSEGRSLMLNLIEQEKKRDRAFILALHEPMNGWDVIRLPLESD